MKTNLRTANTWNSEFLTSDGDTPTQTGIIYRDNNSKSVGNTWLFLVRSVAIAGNLCLYLRCCLFRLFGILRFRVMPFLAQKRATKINATHPIQVTPIGGGRLEALRIPCRWTFNNNRTFSFLHQFHSQRKKAIKTACRWTK